MDVDEDNTLSISPHELRNKHRFYRMFFKKTKKL